MKPEQQPGTQAGISRREFTAAIPLATAPAAWVTAGGESQAGDAPERTLRPDADRYQPAVDRAIGFLRLQSEAQDGVFGTQAGIGITALVTAALLRNGCTVRDPLVGRSLRHLEGFVEAEGRIRSQGGMLANYETSLVIMCLSLANADGRYDWLIQTAEAYIKQSQWDEAQGKDPSDPSYGGAGYGKHKRPDLSNTAFFVEALKSCGRGPDDPAIQKALVFVSRCQNLESEHNTTPFAVKNPDGGFYYTCAAGGSSPAGASPNGGLRSYASMTYSGLKSMIYAGLGPKDPRVQAAVAWIGQHYDLASNPGLGDAGLYYYYHVFSKTLDVMAVDLFEDAAGTGHDWRRELADELVRRQQENGAWVNSNVRWMEGDPSLVTGYALLSLAYCRSVSPEA